MIVMFGARHRNDISKICCDDHPDALQVYYKGTLSYIDGCWVGCGKLYCKSRRFELHLGMTGNLFW